VLARGLRILREEGVGAFIKKASLYVSHVFGLFIESSLGYAFGPLIVKKFKDSVRNIDNIHDALDFAFSFQVLGVSIKPAQVEYEIAKLLGVLADLRPKVNLEIGTAGGGTLFLFTRVADPKAKIISIDLPGGRFGGGYRKWKIPLYKSFSKERQKIYLLRRDSHDPQTLEEVKRILGGEEVDFLFIDGDHTYGGVKRDFEMYSPLARKGGIIAFHDIVPGPYENVGGVPEFWSQIKTKYEHLEIVKDSNQRGFGIGIIFVL
jgi:predicted O-methyltransferase YrrM